MISFLLFVFASIGLTNILVHGKIMDVIGLRCWLKEHMSSDWYQLFECYECSGFWAGLFCGVFCCFAGWYPWWVILLCGFAGSVFSSTYTDVMYLLRSKIEFVVGHEDENGKNGSE